MIQNDVNNRVQCINVDSTIKPSLVTLISVTTNFYLVDYFMSLAGPILIIKMTAGHDCFSIPIGTA